MPDKAKIEVPAEDDKKEMTEDESLEERKAKEAEEQEKLAKKKPDDEDDEEDLTPEERKLKEDLEELVKIVMEKKEGEDEEKAAGIQKNALEAMRKEIRSSTSSMTSVPLPLKFLRPYYKPMEEFYATMKEGANKKFLADILSILAMTMGGKDRKSLQYKLAGSSEEVGSWGHEYVRNLAGEIGQQWEQNQEDKKPVDDLLKLVSEIIPFNMSHNAEFEAIDLLIEVERLDDLQVLINADNIRQICPYLLSCSSYIEDPDEKAKMLNIAYKAYTEQKQMADALLVALKIDNKELVLKTVNDTEDEVMKKQLAYIIATQRMVLPEFEDEDDEDFIDVVGNVKLQSHFLHLAQELDVTEAKTPDDIYKAHLEEGGSSLSRRTRTTTGASVDSAKQNLAATFVNAFVNCGFGKDLLITPNGSDWLFKNKTHGMMSAAGSLGMILLWDVECGFSTVDKYSHSQHNYIKAGALMASGILGAGVTSEMDAAQAILSEHVEGSDKDMKISSIFGLGLAYAGSAREDLLEVLVPPIMEEGQSMEVVALTCLSLGLVYCGTGNDDVSGTIIEAFMDRTETDLNQSDATIMCVGLGLLFIGQGESAEPAIAAIAAIDHPIKDCLALTIQTMAYVGSGSMLEIQKLLQVCSEHIKEDEEEEEKKTPAAGAGGAAAAAMAAAAAASAAAAATPEEGEETPEEKKKKKMENAFRSRQQQLATIGIAMIATGDKLSSTMALRTLDHLLQYGEVNIRRAVPLALGFLSVSNPQLTVMDTLSKLSHDGDQVVSQNACLALGFLGAGTNNSRIAAMLRQLATYYAKEPNHLFLVRIAQGMLHMGKGLMTLDPFHSENTLMSKVAMAGLLTIILTSIDMKNSILNKQHYLLFSLVTAVRPRCLITLDEELNDIAVPVMVGTAVDTVGMAGNPKRITGFQQHTTPVLLAHGERAEFSTEKYIPLTNILEGVVICKLNPDYESDEEEPAKK